MRDRLNSPKEYNKLPSVVCSAFDDKLLAGLVQWATMTGGSKVVLAVSKLDAEVESRIAKNKSSPLLCFPRYEAGDVELAIKKFKAEGGSKDERAWMLGRAGTGSILRADANFPEDPANNGRALTKAQRKARQ